MGFVAGMKQLAAEHLVHANARANQQLGTGPFRKREHHQKEQSDDRHHQQGAGILADQHTVIHLKHVERGREHQQVGNHAEQTRHHEFIAKVPQRAR